MKISILGDSVSTYTGYNPEDYAVYYQEPMLWKNGMESVNDTWWMQVITALGGELCMNDSYSGSRVAGKRFPAACSDERIRMLRNENASPDLILVYIGYNDWGYGVIPQRTGLPFLFRHDPEVFDDAYELMLTKLKASYPGADIVCGTLIKTCLEGDEEWKFPSRFGGFEFDEYNRLIRACCRKKGCRLAELREQDIRYETHDGSHPTKKGHRQIAELWLNVLSDGRSVRTF
jgi:lysophospholipase L1-like esterase